MTISVQDRELRDEFDRLKSEVERLENLLWHSFYEKHRRNGAGPSAGKLADAEFNQVRGNVGLPPAGTKGADR